MRKIFIYPPSSLVLSEIISHFGHEPLTMMEAVKRNRKKASESDERRDIPFDPRRGLKYAPIELPSGVRGRLSVLGCLIEEAEAAVIMEGADFGFGCGGCARTNELIPYIISQQGIPYIKVSCPADEDAAKVMVKKIRDFLAELEEV